MKLKLLEIETSVKRKHNPILSTLNYRRCRKDSVLHLEDGCIEEEEDEEGHVSTQFPQTQKNQLIDLQDHLKRY